MGGEGLALMGFQGVEHDSLARSQGPAVRAA